jgi:hypothetical protein
MMGALVGPAGRPCRRRAKNMNSKSDRVREREVGIVSNLWKVVSRHARGPSASLLVCRAH